MTHRRFSTDGACSKFTDNLHLKRSATRRVMTFLMILGLRDRSRISRLSERNRAIHGAANFGQIVGDLIQLLGSVCP
jgi:hypothetical protein